MDVVVIKHALDFEKADILVIHVNNRGYHLLLVSYLVLYI